MGRHIAWSYYRSNYNELLYEYGADDPRLGVMLLDISDSFETIYLFSELLQFVLFNMQGASADARFKSLEIVASNIMWLINKEDEIEAAFNSPRLWHNNLISSGVSVNRNPLLEPIDRSRSSDFFATRARDLVAKAFAETKVEIFSDYLIKTLRQ